MNHTYVASLEPNVLQCTSKCHCQWTKKCCNCQTHTCAPTFWATENTLLQNVLQTSCGTSMFKLLLCLGGVMTWAKMVCHGNGWGSIFRKRVMILEWSRPPPLNGIECCGGRSITFCMFLLLCFDLHCGLWPQECANYDKIMFAPRLQSQPTWNKTIKQRLIARTKKQHKDVQNITGLLWEQSIELLMHMLSKKGISRRRQVSTKATELPLKGPCISV